MSDRTIQAKDTVVGSLGRAYLTIDGRREELLYVKNVEVNMDKNKIEIPVLGKTGKVYRAAGWSGSGSMTIYYATSLFRELAVRYAETGEDFYFDLVIENEDKGSNLGKQTVLFQGCNLDNIPLGKLTAEDEILEEDFDFTVEDYKVLTSFNPVVGR